MAPIQINGTSGISGVDGSAGTPAIQGTDTNTGISFPTADTVVISTNGSGRLFVDSSGRVGVGTASPGERLDVEGAIRLRSGNYLFFNNAANDSLTLIANTGSSGAGNLQFNTGGAERLRITSGGLVGIGTSSPGCKIDVLAESNTSLAPTLRINSNNVAVNTSLAYDGLVGSGELYVRTSSANKLYLGTNNTNALTIDSSQRVGIGTSSPSAILHALGTQTAGTIRPLMVDNASGSGTSLAGISFANSGNIKSSINAAVLNDDYMTFCVGGSGTTERVRIDGSGRVGIGTTSPGAKLDVATGALSGAILVGGDVNTDTGARTDATRKYFVMGAYPYTNAHQKSTLLVADNDGTDNIVYLGGGQSALNAATSLRFHTAGNNNTASGTERARIDSSGRLLVGTSSTFSSSGGIAYIQHSSDGLSVYATSIYDYHVLLLRSGRAGTAFSARFIDFKRDNDTSVGSITGTGSSVSYNTSSDYRLKENITPVSDGITRLQQLKPSRFNFIADPTKTVDGFIAHEVQTVVPEAITGKKDAVDADGNPVYQGIDQSKLVPLLTAALQEAIGEIESLKARVAALEAA